MTTKQALCALNLLIEMVSDSILRKTIHLALDLLVRSFEEATVSAADLRIENEKLTAELETARREHEDHHREAERVMEVERSSSVQLGQMLDENRRLKAELANLKAANAITTGAARKATLQITEASRSNRIAAIKGLRELLGIGLAEAKDMTEVAINCGKLITPVSNILPRVDTDYWKEVES